MTKELYFVDTLVSVKYNKTLKTLPLRLYGSIQLLMGVLSCDKYSTRLRLVLVPTLFSSQVVYFIQTGGSALSNTYCILCGEVYSSWRVLSCDKYSTRLRLMLALFPSSRVVYFIQTGGSALSNTYSYVVVNLKAMN